ncbi:MAG TPA: hypothetical protein VNK95_09545 [Caldilineaceae bacterium]|nr:hypothetical protein [Caldilineaceae bacterium]
MNETLEIPTAHLDYQLRDGFIDHWLVAGPLAVPVTDLARFRGPDFKAQIARAMFRAESGITQPPAERASFELAVGDQAPQRLTWQVVRCAEDHFVDLSGFYHTCHYLCAWAYAQVVAPVTLQTELALTTNGPADVWLNGEHVHRHTHFHHQIPQTVRFTAKICEGTNEILVRFEGVAVRECPFAMALQIANAGQAGYPAGEAYRVALPTTLEPVARRQKLAELMEHAYLMRDVYHRDDKLEVRWPQDMKLVGDLTARLQTPAGRIYAEGQPLVRGGTVHSLGPVYNAPDGVYEVLLMPKPEEYYLHDMRVQHRLPLRISNNKYSQGYYGTFEQRRREALEDAARRNVNVYSEIAKMALGEWSKVKVEVIEQAIENINNRADCSDFYLVGLLGMLHRFGGDPSFPKEVEFVLADCALNFKYWMDEPGEDAMCYWSENHQILFHACEVLAGQLYPDRMFSNVGETGAWHRQKGERMALAWLRKRAAGGFREWDSNTYFEEDVLALAHLADLAENVEVAEMAAVVLDKLLFTLAVNSYKGVFGSTHGRTYTPYIRGGRFEPTSGIGRLMWGMGVFNDRILGTVSLACATGYQMPELIAAIALDQPEEMWNRERHAGEMEEAVDRDSGPWEVNKVTYKTPDYMLCSAQDYRPGEAGYQQHIWQATLGPDAVVFVTHPACSADDNCHRPNFWHGNRILPRVAQWKDVLMAVHRLPAEDWMGFTHAYFPVAAFDETEIKDGWAFARKGNGYLALTAAQGLELITAGRTAYRELRSWGRNNIWLCQMGRAALDGSFADFKAKVLALEVAFEATSLRFLSLRNEVVAFGWEGPLLVNGAVQPLAGFPHYDNPYCYAELPAQVMELRYRDNAMRLVFSER